MKLVVFTRYEDMGASSRVRSYDMSDALAEPFTDLSFKYLIDNNQLKRLYEGKHYSAASICCSYIIRFFQLLFVKNNSVILIEKELFPGVPYFVEYLLLYRKTYVLDYDDSIFHNYDLNRFWFVRFLLGKKIDKLMKRSALVMCGSHYIMERAEQAGASNVKLIPTVVSSDRYKPVPQKSNTSPVIVWIGTPQTSKYLNVINDVLSRVAQQYEFTLRIIGDPHINIEGVNIEHVAWSVDSEVESIATADIGIMPLENTPWEKGKCGYKLIQYMACGLPVIGSAIGENNYIITAQCGFAASTENEWTTALISLLESKQLRVSMGQEGRSRAEAMYATEAVGPKLSQVLQDVLISERYN